MIHPSREPPAAPFESFADEVRDALKHAWGVDAPEAWEPKSSLFQSQIEDAVAKALQSQELNALCPNCRSLFTITLTATVKGEYRPYSDEAEELLEARKTALRRPAPRQANKGIPRPPATSTFPLLDDYIAHALGRGLSQNTAARYAEDVSPFLGFLERQGVAVGRADASHVRLYLDDLTGRGIAPNSLVRILGEIRRFFKWADGQGKVEPPPEGVRSIRAMSNRKSVHRLPEHLSVREVNQLIDSFNEPTPAGLRDRLALELLYGAGLRVAELVALDVDDLDLDLRQVHVRHGKGDKERISVFGWPAAEAANRYLKHGRPQLAVKRQPSQALFLNKFGQRLTVKAVQTAVSAGGALLGIATRVHPHLLRHSMATHLADAGMDIALIAEQLGHSNIETTTIYTHVSNAAKRSGMEDAFAGLTRAEMARVAQWDRAIPRFMAREESRIA